MGEASITDSILTDDEFERRVFDATAGGISNGDITVNDVRCILADRRALRAERDELQVALEAAEAAWRWGR